MAASGRRLSAAPKGTEVDGRRAGPSIPRFRIGRKHPDLSDGRDVGSSSITSLHKLAAILLVALALTSCGGQSLEGLVREESIAPAAIVRLSDDWAVAAVRSTASVRVLGLRSQPSGWVLEQLASFEIKGAVASANLVSYDGETGLDWNTFVYGTAPRTVSRVEIEGYSGDGGQVVDGAWVIALREKGLGPSDVRWRFLSALGGVIDSGAGIFPPASRGGWRWRTCRSC